MRGQVSREADGAPIPWSASVRILHVEQVRLHAVRNDVDAALLLRPELQQPGLDPFAHGDHVRSAGGQSAIERPTYGAAQPLRQPQRVERELRLERRMGVVDQGAGRGAGQLGNEQPLVMVGVNDLDVVTALDVTERAHEQRIEDEQLRVGRAGRVVAIPAQIRDPVHLYGTILDRIAQMIGDDVNLVAASGHRLGKSMDPDRRAPAVWKGTSRHHGHPQRPSARRRPLTHVL